MSNPYKSPEPENKAEDDHSFIDELAMGVFVLGAAAVIFALIYLIFEFLGWNCC